MNEWELCRRERRRGVKASLCFVSHAHLHTHTLCALCCVAAELGDYSQDENLPGYLSEYSFIPNAPQDFEKEIAKQHQQHK